LSQNIKKNRSNLISGIEIKELSKISYELYTLLAKSQKSFSFETLVLPKNKLRELSETIVEFAEDVLSKVGIWESLEFYNNDLFGTPLPYSLPCNMHAPEQAISKERLHYLLWNKYTDLISDYIISPGHRDIDFIAEVVYNFFKRQSNKITSLKNSTLKKFFNSSNLYGWQVKKKLIWLGKHSYLFRHSYKNYIDKNGGREDIPVIDDFMCQNSTNWSGLGVPDILASVLDLSGNKRNELKSWYKRHLSYYKIKKINNDMLEVNNIINDRKYLIRVGEESRLFRIGRIILGSLVPWNGEWYWSGLQSDFGELSADEIKEIKKDFIQKSPQIIYRFYDSLLKKSKESNKVYYQNFIKFHGDNLKVFPDGHSMASAIQKQHRLEYEGQDKNKIKGVMERHNLKNPWPNYSYPQDLLDSDDGIGLFYNPDEGMEIMLSFNDLLSGLEKKGGNLSELETDAIRNFIESESISVNFVKKVVERYGSQSILETFLIMDRDDIDYLAYILRCYKGDYYRNRYPNLSFH